MKKHIISTVLVLSLLFNLCATATATTYATPIRPTLSISGSTASCRVSIFESGKEIKATLELWCGSTLLDTWSGSATSRLIITGSHAVTSGKTYMLKVLGTIDGSSFSATPVIMTAP